jgi:hypothetical protein
MLNVKKETKNINKQKRTEVEDCKAKMALGSVGTFSPGLTENILKSVKAIANFKAF